MNGPMKATEIIKETGIPQPRIYDIIGKLEKRGLINIGSSLKRSYEAIMPSEAFKNELDSMEKYINQLDEFVKYNRKNVALKSPNVWFIENDIRIASKLEKYLENANIEILLSLPGWKIRKLLPTLRKVSGHDITICSVVSEDIGEGLINSLCEIGICKVRKVPPAEMVIIDRKISFLNAKSVSETSDYSIFIQEEELVDVMAYYFFYMNWLPSEYRMNFNKIKKIRVITSWLACEAIDEMKKNGMQLHGHVNGFFRGREIVVSGKIISSIRIQGIQQAFLIEEDGKKYSVGAKNGKLEDIKMEEVIIEVINANQT